MHELYDFWLKSWNLAEVFNFMCLSNVDMEQLRNIMGCRDISGIQLKPEVKNFKPEVDFKKHNWLI